MADIKSEVSSAGSFTEELKSSSGRAGTLPSVAAAVQVSVPVNRDCLQAYAEGVSTFSSYQTVAARDSERVCTAAETLAQTDQSITDQIQRGGR